MIKDVFNLLLITGAIYGLLFNFVTLSFFPKRKISKAIAFLNLLVLSISLNNLQAWLIAKGFISTWFYIKHLEVPWYLFIVPAFYNFLIYFLKIKTIYKNYILLIFGLFVFEILVRLGLITYCYNTGQSDEIITIYTQYEEILNVFFSLFLFWKCYRIIFKEPNSDRFSISSDDLKWLKYFMALGSIVLLFWVMAVLTNVFLFVPQDYMYYPLRFGSSLLLYWTGYQGFIRYNVRTDRIQLRQDILNMSESIGERKLTIIKPKSESLNKILEQIQTEKLFLNPNLNLEDCAKALKISTSHLSKTINSSRLYNFTDLINLYRVNYAKFLLKNPDFEHYTILSIGLESGFNSKSTFYSAFKKISGQSPTDYKKDQIKP